MRKSSKRSGLLLACAASFAAGSASASEWLIKTFDPAGFVSDYTSADQLAAGFKLKAGFPVSSNYTLTNVNDNGDGSGVVGLPTGQQIVGLPGGVDNNDFVFVGTGSVTVNTAGNYVVISNTDDGSRFKVSVNGGPFSQIITDNVLSGGHDVASGSNALPAGVNVAFNWMWFERGGGAHGNITYSRDGGPRVPIGDSSQGLTLNGGTFNGTVYQADTSGAITLGPNVGGNYNGLAVAKGIAANPSNVRASTISNVFNLTGNGGSGFFSGDARPPGLPQGDINNYVVTGTGFLKVVFESDYRFGSLSDDGAEMILKSQDGSSIIASITDDSFHGAGFPGDVKLSNVVHLTPGFYPLSYLFFEAGGGDTGELFLVNPEYTGPDNAIPANQVIALVGDTASGGLEVVQSVPEPASLSLIGLGVLGLIRRSRRA